SPAATFAGGNYIVAGSTFDFNGTGAETVPAFNYDNLTISGTRTSNSVTLAAGTVGVTGALIPAASFTTGAYVTPGNTVNFNGTGAQVVPNFNYNNLTISGARTSNNVTLVGATGVAGTFNPSATFSTGSFVTSGNTIAFNGAGAQTIPTFSYRGLS